jgi:putative addiction module killer protein
MESRPRKIQIYEGADGERPFETWFNSLQPLRAKTSIAARLDRVERGVLGDWKSVQDGVCELRVHDGPGYRVYFGFDGDVIVLLRGGTKSTQSRDIKKAVRCWGDYNA